MHSGVRATATGHVSHQDQVTKELIDLAPLSLAYYLSFSGVMDSSYMIVKLSDGAECGSRSLSLSKGAGGAFGGLRVPIFRTLREG